MRVPAKPCGSQDGRSARVVARVIDRRVGRAALSMGRQFGPDNRKRYDCDADTPPLRSSTKCQAMTIWIDAALIAFCLAHLLHFGSCLFAGARLAGSRRSLASEPATPALQVTVLAPLDRVGTYSEKCIEALFRLEHRHLELLFCLCEPNPDMLALIDTMRRAYPDVEARVLIGRDTQSKNPKLDNLQKGWMAARHPWVLIVDDNVAVPSDLIAHLAGSLRPEIGVICTVVYGIEPANFWAEVESAFLGPLSARLLLATELASQGWAMGKVMLVPRLVFEELGGLDALRAFPAEDFGASEVARRVGLQTRFADLGVPQPLGIRSFRAVSARLMRWAILRRHQTPFLYVFEPLVTWFVPAALAANAAAQAGIAILPLVLTSISLSIAIEIGFSRYLGWPTSLLTPFAILVRDGLAVLIWVFSWFRVGYDWRGHSINLQDHPLPNQYSDQ